MLLRTGANKKASNVGHLKDSSDGPRPEGNPKAEIYRSKAQTHSQSGATALIFLQNIEISLLVIQYYENC